MTNYANIRYQPAAASTTTVADMAALIALTGMSNGDQALVQATNKLYMYSGTGWYLIATIQNDAPSAITGVSGTYNLAIDGTATTITAASTDPEGFPLTWSYSTSGLGSIATVSNTDNVFTITPSTNEADIGTFTLTINATDGVNGAVSASTNLTLEFIVIVTNSRYTTLLATATGTSDNNNITDASTNTHSITVSGDAHAGTFSPYRHGGYSLYNTSTNHIQTSGLTAPATGDFTIEAWVYVTNNSANQNVIWDTRLVSQDGTNGSYIIFTNSNKFTFGTGGTTYFTTTSTYNTNEWLHVALVRDGSTARLYINGVLGGSTSNSTNWNSGDINIGSNRSGASVFNGYIRDLRVANEVVYSGAFTPPTGSLTTTGGEYSDTTNVNTSLTTTQLLTCHLPYLADGSSNDRSITVTGSVETKPFGPYDYLEYSATDHGGSINFDGTSDYLTIPDHSSLNFASNDWTIECWIYPRTNVGDCGIWHQSASGGLDWFGLYLDGSFNPKFVLKNNNAEEWNGTAAANTAPQNAWTHIALVRRFGTDIKLYANGKVVHTETQNLNVALENKSYNHIIGYQRFVGSGNAFDGLISDFKIDVGTAHYTAEFTPPTAPLSSSGAELHIKGTDASIIDKSQVSNLNLVGNTTGSTTQVKFADTKSMYFDGSGDYIKTPTSTYYNLPADFTIEAWIYPTALTSNRLIVDTYNASQAGSYQLYWRSNGGSLAFYTQADGVVLQDSSGSNIQVNTWHHVAVTRSGSTLRMFVDGTQVNSTTFTRDLTHGIPVAIGYQQATGTNYFAGYMQDVRITKGLARYTANFTPPTASLEG